MMLATVGGNPYDITTLLNIQPYNNQYWFYNTMTSFSFGEIEKETKTKYKKKIADFLSNDKTKFAMEILYKDNRKKATISALWAIYVVLNLILFD